MPAPDLVTAELTLTGRITTASNATFLGSIGDVMVVYKPIAGESPLWDFPHGTLAHREVAAYLVSEVFGWDVVPHTWLRDGPMGEGMVQLWQEKDPDQKRRGPGRDGRRTGDRLETRSRGTRMRTDGWSPSFTKTRQRSDAWRCSTSSSTTPTAKAITFLP